MYPNSVEAKNLLGFYKTAVSCEVVLSPLIVHFGKQLCPELLMLQSRKKETTMRIPEPPNDVDQLDLMRLLNSYAEGQATWFLDGTPLGPHLKQACRSLHTQIIELVTHVFAFVLDRVNAREMDMFTMHDRRHGAKVAHLMWHIIAPERRKHLSPLEIGMLILAAYLHDAGMALTRSERESRLALNSDLWLNLENSEDTKDAFFQLKAKSSDQSLPESSRRKAELELQQAEEALLTTDTRSRHATPERYRDLLTLMSKFHTQDQVRVPDVERGMSFDGDSFMLNLIDVCASHNESAEALVERDRENSQLRRFPRTYPVGGANADLQLIGAALRLADILDFDRERTPALLFYYLLPGGLSVGENMSRLEWSKHLAISNWEITETEVVFRGRCTSHIVHHAIVHFCKSIEAEIASTHASFTALEEQGTWPFALPKAVRTEIFEEGYRYVPYSFELDDARIYQLLMGGAIYDDPLVAIRELIQNAVDACKLRDAMTELYDPAVKPGTQDRITVTYEEPEGDNALPMLTVADTGTGMDAWVIERWFLKIGRSYYSSTEFSKTRLSLRAKNLDFAPVSAFGIGFLSCFLLADRVEVETAMWDAIRDDPRKRHLTIDGPTRLIRVREDANTGAGRFKGTKVKLHLRPTSRQKGRLTRYWDRRFLITIADPRPDGKSEDTKQQPPSWEEVKAYIFDNCVELPYILKLEHLRRALVESIEVLPQTQLMLRTDLEKHAVRIHVEDPAVGIEGEIALVPSSVGTRRQKAQFKRSAIATQDGGQPHPPSLLVRGGFKVGGVPGLPFAGSEPLIFARVRHTWQNANDLRYGAVNLARNMPVAEEEIAYAVAKSWMTHLIRHRAALPKGLSSEVSIAPLWGYSDSPVDKLVFLEEFDAYQLYEWARDPWLRSLRPAERANVALWERGEEVLVLLPSYADLWGDLLWLTLPRIVPKLTRSSKGQIAMSPPTPDWEHKLAGCKDFIKNRIQWRPYAEFAKEISDLLYKEWDDGIETMNIAFEGRLSEFSDREISEVLEILTQLMAGQLDREQVRLKDDEIKLLRKIYPLINEAKIASYTGFRGAVKDLNLKF